MTVRRLVSAGAVSLGLVALLGAVGVAAPASGSTAASSSSASAAGVCTDSSGVTVVVDMSALGGSVIVRCAKGSGFSGLDALKKAGFSITGTQRFGNAYVCRIHGRPSATEALPITGNTGYKEGCVNTPPPTAYWGYWYAKNGGSWKYSTAGAAGRTVVKGGFEGWAFALNRQGNPPRPAYTPTRPKVPTVPTAPPTSQPTQPGTTSGSSSGGGGGGDGGNEGGGGSDDVDADAQTSGADPPSATGDPEPDQGGGTTSAEAGQGQPKQRPGDKGTGDKTPGDETTEAASPTGSAADSATDGVAVTGELPEDPGAAQASSSSAVATVIGLGLLIVLGGGAGITAWRRSHRG